MRKKNLNAGLSRSALYLVYLALTIGLAYWMFWATGEHKRFSSALAVAVPIMLLMPITYCFWLLVFPLLLMVGIYSPVAHLYGPPNYDRVAALIGTDKTEALEFLGLIPFRYYTILISILIISWLIHKFANKNRLHLYKNKFFLFICVFFLLILAQPLSFFNQIINSISEYNAISNFNIPSTWSNSKINNLKKDYVLIIGESARKDYFQIFGYPLDNNPFLSKANLVSVDGLFSGGTHTAFSLSKMLTDGSDWKPRYDRSFIELAKSAGIQTIWITNNQTRAVSPHDTPLSAFSAQADKHFRLNADSNDMELLDYLFPEIDAKTDASRLFIVHTRGSHPEVCERIRGMVDKYEVEDNVYSYIACYVSSIKLTDKLIELIYDKLQSHKIETNRPFSIIYFSDHGLRTIKENGKFLLIHGDNYRKGFEVPLLKIDSDAKDQKHYKSVKSGLKFTQGLANWMNIENPEIKSYDLFDGKNDMDDSGLEKQIFTNEIDNPIDISKFLKNSSDQNK